ncbi:MAG: hypothetical protein L0206_08360 [Actinobacteria bacterium]|nr:hypothetical protein [Actinomycetota bacterium]
MTIPPPFVVVGPEVERARRGPGRTDTTWTVERSLPVAIQVVGETEAEADGLALGVETAMATLPELFRAFALEETRFGTRASGDTTHHFTVLVFRIEYRTDNTGADL